MAKFTDPTDAFGITGGFSGDGLAISFKHVATAAAVSFKAFITAYEENFKSDWQSEQVFGRMDKIHTFAGTERIISFSFEVLASSNKEARENMANLNRLYRFLYPTYHSPGSDGAGSSATHMAAPPLLQINFSNWMHDGDKGLIGRLDGLNFTPDFEHGFHIDKDNRIFPIMSTVNCVFHVVHTKKLGFISQASEDGETDKRRGQREGWPHPLASGNAITEGFEISSASNSTPAENTSTADAAQNPNGEAVTSENPDRGEDDLLAQANIEQILA